MKHAALDCPFLEDTVGKHRQVPVPQHRLGADSLPLPPASTDLSHLKVIRFDAVMVYYQHSQGIDPQARPHSTSDSWKMHLASSMHIAASSSPRCTDPMLRIRHRSGEATTTIWGKRRRISSRWSYFSSPARHQSPPYLLSRHAAHLSRSPGARARCCT